MGLIVLLSILYVSGVIKAMLLLPKYIINNNSVNEAIICWLATLSWLIVILINIRELYANK